MHTTIQPRAAAPVRRRRLSRRAIAVLGAALILAATLSACGGDDGPRLTIYSGRTSDLLGPLLERFADETGIEIDVRYGDSADLALLIDEEGDRSPADVFVSQSPGATGYLAEADRLEVLPDDVLELVDARYRSDAGQWVGLSGRVRTLVYNTDDVDSDQLPASVFDLTDERFRGQIGVSPSNGSFQDFVSAMRESVGDDRTLAWLEGLAANDVRTYSNNRAIVEAVGRGEIDYGLVNHYYNLRAKADDPAVASENHFFADGDLGGLILVTAASVVDTADDAAAAQRFVRFLLSEESQRYFAEETFEYPLVAGVEAVGDQPALDSLPAPVEDLSELGGDLRRTQELIDQSGIAG